MHITPVSQPQTPIAPIKRHAQPPPVPQIRPEVRADPAPGTRTDRPVQITPTPAGPTKSDPLPPPGDDLGERPDAPQVDREALMQKISNWKRIADKYGITGVNFREMFLRAARGEELQLVLRSDSDSGDGGPTFEVSA